MSALYIAAGINHFRSPNTYYKIMPSYLPYHYTLIYISGIFETGFGILLLFFKTRCFAAWGIIALLVAVFPANVQMLINYNYLNDNDTQLWVAIVRLPLQIPLIWWAYTFTKHNRARKI